MSTAATVVSSRPSIEITPAAPALSTPNLLLALASDPFGIVARCTSLVAFSQTSKEARKKFYQREIYVYLRQQNTALVYQKISTPWAVNAEACIREFLRKKPALALQVSNRTGIFGYLEKEDLKKAISTIDSEDATMDDLYHILRAVSNKEDAQWISRFRWLSSIREETDPALHAFFTSVESLESPAKQAAALRKWLKDRLAENQFNLDANWMDALASLERWVPPEFFDIPMQAKELNTLFKYGAHWGSVDFIKRVIESNRFQEIDPNILGRAFCDACVHGDSGVASLLMNSGRFHEINWYASVNQRIRDAARTNPRFGTMLLSQMPLESLQNLIFHHSRMEAYQNDWRPSTFKLDYSRKEHDWAPFIHLLSLKRLEQLFTLLCNETNNPELRKFFLSLLNHPRMAQLKTSTIVNGLFTVAGGEAIARTASAATAYYLGTHMDMLPGPVASLGTASCTVGAIAGLTKEKVASAAKSIVGILRSQTMLKEKAVVLWQLLAELKKRTPLHKR